MSRAALTAARTARAREPLKLALSSMTSSEFREVLSSGVRVDLNSEVRVDLGSEDRVDLSSEVRVDPSLEVRVDPSPEVRLSPEEVRHILISLNRDSVTSRANMVSPCELKETSVLSCLFHPCQYNQNVLCQ